MQITACENRLALDKGLKYALSRCRMQWKPLLTAILLLGFSAMSVAQNVSITCKNKNLKDVFAEVKNQTNYSVFGRNDLFRDAHPVSVSVSQMQLDKFLNLILKDQPIQYRLNGTDIILSRKAPVQFIPASVNEVSDQAYQDPELFVTGKVTNTDGQPLAGASVMARKSKDAAVSDANGKFTIRVLDGDVLEISFVGFVSQEISINGKTSLNIQLKNEEEKLNDVVVTGIVNRNAQSFTGSSTRFSRKELQKGGVLNVFQSLKSMDPSLNIFDNLTYGSDPNRMPDMQIRGTTSFPDIKGQYTQNPNQPLFIVDGFEMSIAKVNDLDLNRIESLTILKDASAKALYGSRAANGVIVIETLKVKPGELRVNYTGSFGIEVADLTSYNLTNASEKLDLEKQLGAYNRQQPVAGLVYDSLYYHNLLEVQNGVNTDWLSQAVRNGFNNKHTVNFEVGDERLRTGFTVFVNNTQGVMKGSERKNLGGAFNLTYRYGKILFRNIMQYTGTKSANSPYGEFSEYAKLNPYWRRDNTDGTIRKFLGIGPILSGNVYNPMYNATINTSSTGEYTDFTNNSFLEYMASRSVKLIARIGFSNTISSNEVFYPGSHTKFIGFTGENIFLRGSYDMTNAKASMISGDLFMNYSKNWGKHSLFTNVGANIREDNMEAYAHSAIGFPNDRMDNIIFAKQYALNGKPSGSESINREIGALGVANYSYDNRYFADVSLRTSASSQFGSENRWGSFWSAGAGWNLHNENFFGAGSAVKMMKLRGSMGYTGAQNFNSYQALLLYNYFVDNSYQGLLGTYLEGLANPELKWQEKLDYNAGMDVNLWNRLSLRVDLYRSITTNTLTDITTPPSLGFASYKANLGEITNTGIEFAASYRMFVNTAKRQSLNLFFNGLANKNTINKISNSLKSITDEQDRLSRTSNKPLVRFEEGQSLNAIWAVPSKGIDPATGKEIFVKRDGTYTDVWDAADKVAVGVDQPKLYGNFGANFEIKGFAIGVISRYRMGGQIYNQTLVDKVENAQLNFNVDKRAYYNSWKKPGDVVLFRSIGTVNSPTLATSRFVQDLSELSIASVNMSYDFYRHGFVKRMGMERMQVLFNMNDVYTFSSVQIERGTAYPFARFATFTVLANF